MTPSEINAKEKIFKAAMALITAGEDMKRITTRRIAGKAGVNPALVNYYYQSKENLINQVVGTMMGGIIGQVLQEDWEHAHAHTRLKKILVATAHTAFKHYNVCKIAISVELKNGCRSSCEMVMPLLKEIFRGYGQSDLDIIAMQLLIPFHHIVVNPRLYGEYLNTDFFDPDQRERKINQMIDCVLCESSKEVE